MRGFPPFIDTISLPAPTSLPHSPGIIGLVVSALISILSSCGKDSALVTTISGFVMAVLYTICAGLLTFENGPATFVGNQYFSAWAGFFLSFAVFGSVLREFLGVGGGANASAAAPAQSDGESMQYHYFTSSLAMLYGRVGLVPQEFSHWLQLLLFDILGDDVEMDRI